jgi:hypothetical protein
MYTNYLMFSFYIRTSWRSASLSTNRLIANAVRENKISSEVNWTVQRKCSKCYPLSLASVF